MMMARMHTGTYDLISFRNAYHGMSPSTNGLTAHSTWRYNLAGNFGIHQVNYSNKIFIASYLNETIYQPFYKDYECGSLPWGMGR